MSLAGSPPEGHHIGLASELRLELGRAPPVAGFRPSGAHLARWLMKGSGVA